MDQISDLSEWDKTLENVHTRRIKIFAFANNHNSGHPPATVEMFRGMRPTLADVHFFECTAKAIARALLFDRSIADEK